MDFNEYTPKGGWIAYRKRKALIEKIKSTTMAVVALAVYAAAVALVETI